MNLERHGDCNIVSKRTAAKERAICMVYLDQVHCNAVFKNMRLKNSLYQCGKSGLRAFYMNIGSMTHDNFNIVVVLSYVA